jgi:hypothetical protein
MAGRWLMFHKFACCPGLGVTWARHLANQQLLASPDPPTNTLTGRNHMTFNHGGHIGGIGCAGAAGGAGLGGLQDRINEHHDRVVAGVREHTGQAHDRVQEHVGQVREHVQEHVDRVRDAVQNHVGGGGAGESLGGGQPLHLIFPDWVPPVVQDQVFSLQAIGLPGGVTMSLVALVAISCLAIILASALVKTVVVRCST